MATQIADEMSPEFKQAVDRQLLARITALEAELAIAKAKLGPRGDTMDATVQTDPVLADLREQLPPTQVLEERRSGVGTGLLQRLFPSDTGGAGSSGLGPKMGSKTLSEPPRAHFPEEPPQRFKTRVWAYDEHGTFKLMEGEE
jgi:hypothetical protein